MKAKQMLWIGLACALGAAPFAVQAQTKPVVLRFVVGLRRGRRIPPGWR